MTKYEELMVILLQNASNELSCDCVSTKEAKEKIDSFLSSFLIPKEEFNQLFTILKLDSLKDAKASFDKFIEKINIDLMPKQSDKYVDLHDVSTAGSIIKRREANIKKTVDELFAEMEHAYYNVTLECLSRKLREELYKFKRIITSKNVVDTVTVGKDILENITTQKDYYVDDIVIMKINSILFFVRMLEEKTLGFILKKES